MSRLSYTLLLILSFSCCSGFKEKKFPQEIVIAYGEKVPFQGVTNPSDLFVVDGYLVVQNFGREDSLFHVYSLQDFSLKNAFGVIGRGPKEFLFPVIMNVIHPFVYIMDYDNNNQVSKYRLTSEGNVIFEGHPALSKNRNTFDYRMINDSIIIFDAFLNSPDIVVYNINCHETIAKWQYGNPEQQNRYHDENRGHVYANASSVVFCYYLQNRISFRDLHLRSIVDHNYQKEKVVVDTKNFLNNIMHYEYGYLGNKYFYALYNGFSGEVFRNSGEIGCSLEVYDLKGNPIARYFFEEKSPRNFAVDEDSFTLYAYHPDFEDYAMAYHLDGLK